MTKRVASALCLLAGLCCLPLLAADTGSGSTARDVGHSAAAPGAEDMAAKVDRLEKRVAQLEGELAQARSLLQLQQQLQGVRSAATSAPDVRTGSVRGGGDARRGAERTRDGGNRDGGNRAGGRTRAGGDAARTRGPERDDHGDDEEEGGGGGRRSTSSSSSSVPMATTKPAYGAD